MNIIPNFAAQLRAFFSLFESKNQPLFSVFGLASVCVCLISRWRVHRGHFFTVGSTHDTLNLHTVDTAVFRGDMIRHRIYKLCVLCCGPISLFW